MLRTGVILGLAGSPKSQACPGGDDTRFVAINRLVLLGKSTPEPWISPLFLWGFPVDFPNKTNLLIATCHGVLWRKDTGLFGSMSWPWTTCHRAESGLMTSTTLTALTKLEGKVKPMRMQTEWNELADHQPTTMRGA